MPSQEELRLEERRSSARADATASAQGQRAVHPYDHGQYRNGGLPAVGGEKSSEEIINFLLQEFEGDASKIWQSNIFGKSLYDIAGEGLTSKIKKMPEDTQSKLQETLQRIVNEGSGGLICIIL
jgi:stage IV sporulation protein A